MAGIVLVWVLAGTFYKPVHVPKKMNLNESMKDYIVEQKRILEQTETSQFDNKATVQLEQFTDDAIKLTDSAKLGNRRAELQNFGAESSYAWAYNREGLRILLEDMGIRPKHGDGKHCDSVGC